MKVIFECRCGNQAEVSPETIGNVVYFERRLREHDFIIMNSNIDINADFENVESESDIDVKLKEIEIMCRKCGKRIYLDCDC